MLKILTFLVIIALVGALAWLTVSDDDPCANPQADVTGSVLADEGDQDALVNRAIIMKGKCEKQTTPNQVKEQL